MAGDKFNLDRSKNKEEEKKVDLTLRLGGPSAGEDKPEEKGSPPAPIMYDFLGVGEGGSSSSKGKMNISQHFGQHPSYGAMGIAAGGSAIAGAAGFLPVGPVGAIGGPATMFFPQGFVPNRGSPRKRQMADGEDDENKVCASCGKNNTPLWRKGPEGQTLCNACGLRQSRANRKN